MTAPAHPYPAGTRVRHDGEQYPEAFRNGTGTVTDHFWRGPWLEYVIERDTDHPLTAFLGRRTEWSSERTVAIEATP